MIKPIKITPINTSTHLEFKCETCGLSGEITLTNFKINTDNNEKALEDLDYCCPKCNSTLNK